MGDFRVRDFQLGLARNLHIIKIFEKFEKIENFEKLEIENSKKQAKTTNKFRTKADFAIVIDHDDTWI